jgi:5-methylthioadenosine/S-adenosylhomocysteine deaminase
VSPEGAASPSRESGRYLISNGTVLTVDGSDRVIDRGWVRITDGAIDAVSESPIEPTSGYEVLDATNCLVMPGMVNTHTHLFQVLLRNVYDERPLATYLSYIYRSGVELSAEDEHIAAVLASIEAIRSGVTTLVDHHFLNREDDLAVATVEGMQSTGVRAVLARTILDLGDGLPREIVEDADRGLAAVDRLRSHFAEARDSGMVDIWTGPNTPGVNASAEASIASREYAEATGTRRSAHVAEYVGVLESVQRRYGYPGAVEWLSAIGALGPDLLAVHAVQVSPKEVGILAASGASVSHNPFSNLFCGDRNAPVRDYLRAGAAVGIGTDGDANNNGATVLEAVRLTRLLQRLDPSHPMGISLHDGIRMATAGGAAAIGQENRIGTLQVGMRADVTIVDLGHTPHSVPVHDPVAHLLHSGRPGDVRTVIVDGRLVMRDRHILTVDEPEVLRQAQQAATALVARLG